MFQYNDQIEDLRLNVPATLTAEQIALIEILFQEIVLLADAVIAATNSK
jgi:hypothetical protein